MHRLASIMTVVMANGLGSQADNLPVPPGGVVHPLRALNDTSNDYPFLPEWESNLTEGPDGCTDANTGHWNWLICGLGCNMVRECTPNPIH